MKPNDEKVSSWPASDSYII